MYARACLCCAPDRPRAPTTETTPARVARPVCYLTLSKNEREWGARVGERFCPVRASGGERYLPPVPCRRRRVDVHRKLRVLGGARVQSCFSQTLEAVK